MKLPDEMRNSILASLRKQNGEDVVWHGEQRVGGGSVNQAWRIDTSIGVFFLKANSAFDMPGIFEAEARGLERLRQTNTLRIPQVVLQSSVGDYSFLLLEFMSAAPPDQRHCRAFGEKLAALHRTTWKAFGLDHSNYISSIRQSNAPRGDWSSFFVEERLEPLVREGVDSALLPQNSVKSFDRLYRKLSQFYPEEPPALLHGDLWYGNYIRLANGETVLIDPAISLGHREVDLAMTRLFGGFGDEFYSGYQEVYPLTSGWEERVALWNLYPLLVHVKLFGAEYVQQLLDSLHCFC